MSSGLEPHPNHDTPEAYDATRLVDPETCKKCGCLGVQVSSYRPATTVYAACDLHFPERIDLQCPRCGHTQWMRPAPSPQSVRYQLAYYGRPWWKIIFGVDTPIMEPEES